MANKIQIKRGLKEDLPQLSAGELGFCTDTEEVFIGNGEENVNIPVNKSINDETPTFTQASSRTNIVSGEKLSVIFGKFKKWFADLKTVAFTGSYGDLENAPAIIDRYDSTFIQGDDIDALRPVTDEKNKIIGFEQVALKTHFSDVAFSNDYNDLANKPEIIYDYDSQPFINGDPVATVSVMKDENGNVEEIRFFEVPLRLSEAAFTGSYNDLTDKPTIPPAVMVDSALSSSSTNPVQNKAINSALATKKRTTTIVVGTSAAGYALNDVDYLCDGTADQEEINTAISALPVNGGKIVLLEGTYNISGSIIVNKSNVAIEGMGIGSTVITSITAIQDGAIRATKSYCSIKNISLLYSGGNTYSTGIRVSEYYSIVENVKISGFSTGIDISSAGNDAHHIVNKVWCHNCGLGIHIDAQKCMAVNCFLISCSEAGFSIMGNYNNILGNYCYDNECGVWLRYGGSYNRVSDNYITRGTGQASDYTDSQTTINMNWGEYNFFADNYILGKNYINGSNTNTFINNRYE